MKLSRFAAVFLFPAILVARETMIDNTGGVENPKPTWETQNKARAVIRAAELAEAGLVPHIKVGS
jgi:hypothetical protein